jgi:phosphoglycolate phosphatase
MFANYIFDWSGTLVDDMGPTIEATNAVFAVHGCPAMDRDTFRSNFRLPYSEFYQEHIPHVPLTDLETDFRKAFANSEVPVTVLPHAREILEWAQAQEIRCFILTSMDSSTFQSQLDDLSLRHFFESTYSGVIDKREMIGHILEHHGLDPTKTVYFGDMVHDIETAKHGGVTSVALLTGYTRHHALQEAEPDWLLEDLAAFRKISSLTITNLSL